MTQDTPNNAVEMNEMHMPDTTAAMGAIQGYIERVWGFPEGSLTEKTREQPKAFARQVAMYIARENTTASLKTVAKFFGLSDHGTVLYACGKIARAIKEPRVETSSREESARKSLLKIIENSKNDQG